MESGIKTISFPLTYLYCTALPCPNHFKKPAKQKDVMTNPLKESHYVLFLFIPLAVIAVATAGLENPCPERLPKLDLANQMNFC